MEQDSVVFRVPERKVRKLTKVLGFIVVTKILWNVVGFKSEGPHPKGIESHTNL